MGTPRRLALLFLLPFSLWAQTTIYLRSHDAKNCRVTGATNASPIVVTCAAAHNMTAGDSVAFIGVSGNLAANGVRFVSTPSATTLGLYSDSGLTTPVVGTGAWNNGTNGTSGAAGGWQIGGAVSAYTMPAQPHVAWGPGYDLIKAAANIENGLLASVVVSGGGTVAVATYTAPHGIIVGQRVCVYGASNAALNCPTALTSSNFYNVTAVTTNTITFTVSGATDGTYNSGNSANLTVSNYAHGDNRQWLAMYLASTELRTGTQYAHGAADNVNNGIKYMSEAMKCYVNRSDTTACTVALWLVERPEVLFRNAGCDESFPGGYCGTNYGDYASFALSHWSKMYDLLRTQISAPTRAILANKILNNVADGCTINAPVTRSGTVTVSQSKFAATTLTGTGTSFLSYLSPGMIIHKPTVNGVFIDNGNWFFVESVVSDTHATGTIEGSFSGDAFQTTANWATGMCGFINFLEHHPGTFGGHPSSHAPRGGTTDSAAVDPLNNMTQSKLTATLHAVSALALDDARARDRLAGYSVFYMDQTHALQRSYVTGAYGNCGTAYHHARCAWQAADLVAAIRNMGGPDLTDAGFLDQFNTFNRFSVGPRTVVDSLPWSTWAWGWDGGGIIWLFGSQYPYSFPASMWLKPNSQEAGKNRYMLDTILNVTAAKWASASQLWAGDIATRSAQIAPVDYTAGPTQYLFRASDTDLAWCAVHNNPACLPAGAGGYQQIYSRTGWTSTNDTTFSAQSEAFGPVDHNQYRSGDYHIFKFQGLVASDHDMSLGGYGGSQFGNNSAFGGISKQLGLYSTAFGQITAQLHYAPILAWAGGADPNGRSDSRFVFAKMNLTPTWQAGVTRQHRHVLHYKRATKQEHVIIYDDAQRAASGTIQYYTHYPQNGQASEGATLCSGGDTTCANLDTNRVVLTATTGTVNSLTTKFLAPSGVTNVVRVEAGNGTYTGGNGHSYRVTHCPGSAGTCGSATAHEMLTVHRITAGSSTAAPSTLVSPSANWTGAENTDVTVLFPRGGSTQTSVPAFTTTNQADLIVTGLAAGTYEVQRGGVPVAGCTNMPVTADDTSLYCADVLAGSISVVLTGSVPSGDSPTRMQGSFGIRGLKIQ